MPKPASDRPHIDAAENQLRRRVVPQLVQRRRNPEPVRHAVVPLRHAVRRREGRAVRFCGERERLSVQLKPEFASPCLAPLPVAVKDVGARRCGAERIRPRNGLLAYRRRRVEPGETFETAIVHEIFEETGHVIEDPGPCIWPRRKSVTDAADVTRATDERYFWCPALLR